MIALIITNIILVVAIVIVEDATNDMAEVNAELKKQLKALEQSERKRKKKCES